MRGILISRSPKRRASIENRPGPIRATAITIMKMRNGTACERDRAGDEDGKINRMLIWATPIVRLVNTVRAPRMSAPPPKDITMPMAHNHAGPLSWLGTKAHPCRNTATPTVALTISRPIPGRPPTYLEKCPVNQVLRPFRCAEHQTPS